MNVFTFKHAVPTVEQASEDHFDKNSEFQLIALNELDLVGGGADIVNLG